MASLRGARVGTVTHRMYMYILAFGPSRHRVWVVGQRVLEYALGSRGRSLGGLLDTVLKRLGCRFGASWGFSWAFGGVPLLGFFGAS
eukprot:2946573-Pyramimonas_sp.AAC.1